MTQRLDTPATERLAGGSPPRGASACGAGRRLVVGIGEFAVSDRPQDLIITHALGSCVAVCVWDPGVKVGGLLHYLLPESTLNPARAARQPAIFADTGIPLLFESLFALGVDKRRAQVKLVGGAEIALLQGGSVLNVGRRNALAGRQIVWRLGILVRAEALGGNAARTVWLQLADGALSVSSGGQNTSL